MAKYDPRTRYIDSGRRTPREHTISNILLGYFHPTEGRTFDEVVDSVIASGWNPPISELYSDRTEQIRYLRGYFTWLVSNGYLISKGG